MFTITFPCWKRYWIPIFVFLLSDSDSCCASEAIMVIRTSPFASIVLMDSFSKKTGMLISFSKRMYFRQSSVLRAKRLIDFVKIMSIFPALQSSIIALNCSLFLVEVALMPSSAYTPTNSHSGFVLMNSS